MKEIRLGHKRLGEATLPGRLKRFRDSVTVGDSRMANAH
jgi:hypothetical protein